VSNRKARFERRVVKRKALKEEERLAALEKFGPAADERRADRRKNSEEDSERILKEMGITDRRRMDRRGKEAW
jgi:hypothetical protein